MPKRTKENLKNKKSRNKLNVNAESNKSTKEEKFCFDEEVVIGLKRIDEVPKSNIKKKKKNKKTKIKAEKDEIIIKSKYMQNYSRDNNIKKNNKDKNKKIQKKEYTKKQEISRRKRKIIFRIIKWLTLIGIIIGGIIYAMLSPIFNIKEIKVNGNFKISSETIISLSGLSIDQNIFNFRTSNVQKSIKQNAYIDKIEINRKLPDKIEIIVAEREPTFMLSLGNAFVYINNQGYILEITDKKINTPMIIGYVTSKEEISAGNRLCTEDLQKLSDVLKIIEAATSLDKKITKLITQVDITDSSNYILTMEKEKKRIYMGDITNLSTKILWLNEFLELEKQNEGNIYLNVNLNNERPYFREKV